MGLCSRLKGSNHVNCLAPGLALLSANLFIITITVFVMVIFTTMLVTAGYW